MSKVSAEKTTIRRIPHSEISGKLSDEQKKEILELMKKRDEDIDLSDIPEIPPDAALATYYRPRKVSVTMRLDADVFAWLKASGEGYQTRINTLLREIMTQQLTAARR